MSDTCRSAENHAGGQLTVPVNSHSRPKGEVPKNNKQPLYDRAQGRRLASVVRLTCTHCSTRTECDECPLDNVCTFIAGIVLVQ